jgi:hypothetical protein
VKQAHPAVDALDPRRSIQFATSPPHLAGCGDPRHITQALRAAGWKTLSDPDYPHVVQVSPDQRHSLVLAPDSYSGTAWWRIRTETWSEGWHAEFGGHIPVQILAGFTDALIRPTPGKEPDVWQPLAQAGWTHTKDEHGNQQALHPDGQLSLRRHAVLGDGAFHWLAEVRLGNGLGGHQRLWHAFLDDRTPRHLLAGFTTALAATAPVQRPMATVPHPHLVTQERSGPQGEALAEAHQQRLAAARTAARKARRAATLQTQHTPAPAAPPTTSARRR